MNVLFTLTIACYIASSLGYQGYVLFQRRSVYKLSSTVLWIGFLCHTGFIALQYFESGHIPVQGLHETLSTFGWAIVGVFLALQIKFNLMVLGALVAPLATLSVVIASILPRPYVEIDPLFRGLWRTFHIGTLILGLAALAIAFLVGVLYLIQEKAIKDKKRGFFFRRLPSLNLLDSMGYSCLITGFPRHLCSDGPWPVLELGPQRDFCRDHLAGLCGLATRTPDRGVARKAGRRYDHCGICNTYLYVFLAFFGVNSFG